MGHKNLLSLKKTQLKILTFFSYKHQPVIDLVKVNFTSFLLFFFIIKSHIIVVTLKLTLCFTSIMLWHIILFGPGLIMEIQK